MDAALSGVCNPHLKHVLRSFQEAANTSLCGPSGPTGWQLAAAAAAAAANRPSSAAFPPSFDVAASYRVGGSGGGAAALSSLKPASGAAAASATAFEFKVPRSVRASPQMPPPILIPPDRSASDKSQTALEGETIACFVVGGEKRLCLPQILNTVLREFTLQQIDKACEELHIYCSRCSPEQLSAFKVAGVLPTIAPSCGLITKTDAERLCNALLYEPRYAEAAASRRLPEDDDDAGAAPSCGIRIYHKCFGKAFGVLYPDAYVSETAKFIECSDCRQLMTARRFVCHTHSDQENRVVHWGFDSDRWRAYVQLDKAQGDLDQMEATLSAVKARFSDRPRKRHQPDRERKDNGDENCKRPRVAQLSAAEANAASADLRRAGDRSAFHRWAPESSPEDLTKDAAARAIAAAAIAGARAAAGAPVPTPPESPASGGLSSITRCSPPVLADPRRVVPLSEADRYGKHFVPNVSLAPPQQQQALKLKLESESVKDDCGDSKTAIAPPGLRDSADDEKSTCLRLQSIGVVQEALKSASAMSKIFAEVLRHASSVIDSRHRLQLEESFADHRTRLESLIGLRETSAAPAATPGAKKLPLQLHSSTPAIAAACGGSLAMHDGRD